MDKTIEEIIDCALLWITDDGVSNLPPEWDETIALMRAAPAMREACKAALAKLTDIERYGEHADNPLPVMLRAALSETAFP